MSTTVLRVKTYDLGPAFVHGIPLNPKSPRLHTATTNEVDEPYRQSKSLVVRLWRTHGFVLGWWRKTDRTEEQALVDALQAHLDVDLLDEDGYLLPNYEPEDVHVFI